MYLYPPNCVVSIVSNPSFVNKVLSQLTPYIPKLPKAEATAFFIIIKKLNLIKPDNKLLDPAAFHFNTGEYYFGYLAIENYLIKIIFIINYLFKLIFMIIFLPCSISHTKNLNFHNFRQSLILSL